LIYGKIGFSIGTKYVHVELFLVGSPAASASVHGDLADGGGAVLVAVATAPCQLLRTT